jgi:transcriptional regulator with XRE-family HTH domain
MITRYFITTLAETKSQKELSQMQVFDSGLTQLVKREPGKNWSTNTLNRAWEVSKQVSVSTQMSTLILEQGSAGIFRIPNMPVVRSNRKKREARKAWSGVSPADFDNKAVGAKIAEYRRKKGIKQYALADHLGVSAGRVSQIETGAAPTTIAVLASIGKFLGVPITELVAAGEIVGPRYFKKYSGCIVFVESDDKNLPRVDYQMSSSISGKGTMGCSLHNWSNPDWASAASAIEITKAEYDQHLRFCTTLFTESMIGKQRPMIVSEEVIDITNYDPKGIHKTK